MYGILTFCFVILLFGQKAAKIGVGAVRTSRSEGSERGRSSVGVEDEEVPPPAGRRSLPSRRRSATSTEPQEVPDEESVGQDDVQIVEYDGEELTELKPMPRRHRSGSDRSERRSIGLERVRRDTAPASYDLNLDPIASQVHVINADEAIGVNGGGSDLPKGLGVRIEGEPGQTTTVITLTDEHSSLTDNTPVSSASQSVIERVRHYDIQDSNFYVNVVETLNTGDIEGSGVPIETVDDQGHVILIEGDEEQQPEEESNNVIEEKNSQVVLDLEKDITDKWSGANTEPLLSADESKSPRSQRRSSQESSSPPKKV